MDEIIDPFPRYTSEPGVLLSYATDMWSADVSQDSVPKLEELQLNDSIKLQLNYENSHEFVWVEVRGKDERFAWGEIMDAPYEIPLPEGAIVHFRPAHVFRWLTEKDYT